MVTKIVSTICILLLIGALSAEAQRGDGRRRSGRRKPTTEIPPPDEETLENEKSPQKLNNEPETIDKSSSAQPVEPQTNAPTSDKEPSNTNQGGPPFIVPRGTRKPRPHVRNSGEARPRPTLPTFSRKRGPKPDRREFKKNEDNSVVSSSTSTPTATAKPTRGSFRNRGNNSQERSSNVDRNSNVERNSNTERNSNVERNPNVEKAPQANDDVPTEVPKKRFRGSNRRQSRGNRRQNAETTES